jgi:hypothetical protein
LKPLNNRDVLFLGALIIAGAVVVELYSDFTNPFIVYAPIGYTNLLIGTPQQFNYYKDGVLIGAYSYTLSNQTSGSSTIYTLNTSVDVVYQFNHLTVNSTYRFLSEVSHMSYGIDFGSNGTKSSLECVFVGNNVTINSYSQGKNQTVSVTLPTNTVLIDNNNPAHWELLAKSFTAPAGSKYNINTFVPQGSVIQQFEYGVDTSHQFVTIGSRSYECVVTREPDFEITLFFYQGNLIQYRNDVDNIVIVKKIP